MGPFEHGLTQLKDEQWKNVRAIVSPTFTTAKLKGVNFSFEHHLSLMISLFRCTV